MSSRSTKGPWLTQCEEQVRILILSQFFDPEPTLKGLAFAKALAAQGHEVEVLTGFPNYPGGKVYPDFKIRPWKREEADGITVYRVALFPSHDRSVMRRVANYLSFALSASVFGPWLVKKPDLLYVYHPPLTVSLPAAILKLVKRCPIVYDIQDLWPDTLGATGMVSNKFVTRAVGRWALAVYQFADRIVVLSPGFRDRLVERGVPSQKIHQIYNWNEESRQGKSVPDRSFAKRWAMVGKFNVVYAGSFGPAQALDSVLDVAGTCKVLLPNVHFLLIGRGIEEERLKLRVLLEGLDNVTFVPHQTMQAMSGILPLADALLVHSKDDPLFAITIPSKTQAYLAVGRPIIIAARGNAADLVREAQAGIVIAPENPKLLFDAIEEMSRMSEEQRSQLGRNGSMYYERVLSMAVGVKKFEEVFQEAKTASELARGLRQKDVYRRFGKRLLDLMIVIPALILLSPLFVLIALLSLWQIGWPVSFQQRRAGKDGRQFSIYKFRSMTDARNADGELRVDSERTPKYGALLRRSSLDELPGLLNVLKGDMSLVGPRPLLPEYLPYYSERHARRHEVSPGITGMAQVNGRQLATFSERMEMDVWYVEHVSLSNDIRLLLLTIPKVFGSRGVVVGQDVRDVDDLGLSRESREHKGQLQRLQGYEG